MSMMQKVCHQRSFATVAVTNSQKSLLPMKPTDKIVVVGFVWNSHQNGAVYDVRGLSPCFVVGQHSGVESKIKVVYETD